MPAVHPNPTKIYHITSVENLPSIIQNGGLLAHSACSEKRIRYTNIAYQGIQDSRDKPHLRRARALFIALLNNYAAAGYQRSRLETPGGWRAARFASHISSHSFLRLMVISIFFGGCGYRRSLHSYYNANVISL